MLREERKELTRDSKICCTVFTFEIWLFGVDQKAKRASISISDLDHNAKREKVKRGEDERESKKKC